jgi:hypothetical protein
MFYHRIHGLNIVSPRQLKNDREFFESADLTIELIENEPSLVGVVESHLLQTGGQKPQALISKYKNGDLSIDYFECGFFYLSGRTLLALQKHSDTDFFDAIISSQILPLISSLFRVTLHGGVVAIKERAIIYLGPEGAGKSTLTTYLMKMGHRVYSDDVAAIDFNFVPQVHAGIPEIRIHEDSCQKLLAPKLIKQLNKKLTKQQILISQSSLAAIPLAAIVLLSPKHECVSSQQTLLTPSQRFMALIQNQFRLDIWNPQILKNEFQTLTMLSETVPCWELEYSMTYDNLPWVAHALERCLPQSSPYDSVTR